jgi:hypothetical protein
MKNLAKVLVLNWHNQNPNKSTVEMLKVLLQWLCSKAWEREFSLPDSNAYVIMSVAWYAYTYKPLKVELIVHYD